MNAKKVINLMMVALVVAIIAPPVCATDTPTEPRGGKPPAGSKPSVENFAEQVTYQRAFEAVVWSMPAMIKYGMRRASIEIGAGDNVVCAWSAGAKPLLETLTPNNTSPYVTSTTDLRKGPVVLEVPKATDKAILFGQVADDWFITIADIGPIGLDKGKGNKILLLPPGYTGDVPVGYAVVLWCYPLEFLPWHPNDRFPRSI